MIIDLDFETYSEAGYELTSGKWKKVGRGGLEEVGAAVYSEHPSTEVLCAAYDLNDGAGMRLHIPNVQGPPLDLLYHIKHGAALRAHNATFEWFIWNNVCVPKYGWPELPVDQLRCTASRCASFALPRKLGEVGKVLKLEHTKLLSGKTDINYYCVPHAKGRNFLASGVARAARFLAYNIRDVEAQQELASRIPPLTPHDFKIWLYTTQMNLTGVTVDTGLVNSAVGLLRQEFAALEGELPQLTGGRIKKGGQTKAIAEFCGLENVQQGTVQEALDDPSTTGDVRRVLQIRQELASSPCKKFEKMSRTTTKDGTIKDNYVYRGAATTGRNTAVGVQIQNLPSAIIQFKACKLCGALTTKNTCPSHPTTETKDVPPDLEALIADIKQLPHTSFRAKWGAVLPCLNSVLRAAFIAPEGYEMINSDYKAIEAVVLAYRTQEPWRMEVFRTHGMLYEMSASLVCGIPFEKFLEHKERTGKDLPERKTIGKPYELALGYQGSIGAAKNFGADKYRTDEQILNDIAAWRAASPKVKEFWGKMEGCAKDAMRNPGQFFAYNGVGYIREPDVLKCVLPSGRCLHYHNPALETVPTAYGVKTELTYWKWNTDRNRGAYGWAKTKTYGGKLTENDIQAEANDIFNYGFINAVEDFLQVIMGTHDELGAQAPIGTRTIEALEAAMTTRLPDCYKDWPITADGGWIAKRFRK